MPDPLRTAPVRGRLARHLGRLRQSLDAAGEQVRDAVARAVGRTVAEAVGEVVHDTLLPCEGRSPPLPRSHTDYSSSSPASRRSWDEPVWERDADRSDCRNAFDDSFDDPRYDDAEPATMPFQTDNPRADRWAQALAYSALSLAWPTLSLAYLLDLVRSAGAFFGQADTL